MIQTPMESMIQTPMTPYQAMIRIVAQNHSVEEKDKIRDRIRSLRALSPGWHYGEGRGATEAAIDTALEIHHLFLENRVRKIELFPDVDGGILVSGYYEEHTFDVFCTPDGKINLLHEVNDEDVTERDNLPMDELVNYLGGLLWRTWKLYDPFIQGISVTQSEGLRALHSKIHQMVEYLSLAPYVPKKVAEQNASIYKLFILSKQGTLSSFGECEHLNSLKTHTMNTSVHLPVTTAT